MINQVTFTGIDARTDIDRLADIQDRYPFAEFGVLLARSRQGKENRYPPIAPLLKKLKGRELNLSLHLCGSMAREAVMGFTSANWLVQSVQNIFDIISEQIRSADDIDTLLDNFHRLQLNISNMENLPKELFIAVPYFLDELIIQQHPQGQDIFSRCTSPTGHLSVLYDGSGGQGIDTPFKPVERCDVRTGYAGGITPENVVEKVQPLLKKNNSWWSNKRNYWIDMESGVRTDDWFDLDKVERVLEAVSPFIDKKAKRKGKRHL